MRDTTKTVVSKSVSEFMAWYRSLPEETRLWYFRTMLRDDAAEEDEARAEEVATTHYTTYFQDLLRETEVK